MIMGLAKMRSHWPVETAGDIVAGGVGFVRGLPLFRDGTGVSPASTGIGDSLKLVIRLHYLTHGFYPHQTKVDVRAGAGATLPSRRPSRRTSHPRERLGWLSGSIYWVRL